MSDKPVPHRSMLARSWGAVSAAPKANIRTAWQMLDMQGIQQSWTMMRDVQRQAFRPSNASTSGIRLIEKDGRLDAEATRARMEVQCRASRVGQDALYAWETATSAEVTAWAAHEVRVNWLNVFLKIGKAVISGLAALLSAWLVTRPGMALMSSIVLLILFIFFAFTSVRAIQNQIYLEALLREDGSQPPSPSIRKNRRDALDRSLH